MERERERGRDRWVDREVFIDVVGMRIFRIGDWWWYYFLSCLKRKRLVLLEREGTNSFCILTSYNCNYEGRNEPLFLYLVSIIVIMIVSNIFLTNSIMRPLELWKVFTYNILIIGFI